jgi:hypothetical protein
MTVTTRTLLPQAWQGGGITTRAHGQPIACQTARQDRVLTFRRPAGASRGARGQWQGAGTAHEQRSWRWWQRPICSPCTSARVVRMPPCGRSPGTSRAYLGGTRVFPVFPGRYAHPSFARAQRCRKTRDMGPVSGVSGGLCARPLSRARTSLAYLAKLPLTEMGFSPPQASPFQGQR